MTTERHGNGAQGWPLVAGGVAAGIGLAVARKLWVQAPTAVAGDWVDGLAGEHAAVRNFLGLLARTERGETKQRRYLLHKIKTALTRHAIQEENLIYPALREAGEEEAAADLTLEHADVKHYLYRLDLLVGQDRAFLDELEAFRADIFRHMEEEERVLFPLLRERLGEERSAQLGLKMNLQGAQFA